MSYDELIKLESYSERLNALRLYSNSPSNSDRELMNQFYKGKSWLCVREKVIMRDCGYDLGVRGIEILGPIIVHHIIPISGEDVLNGSPLLFDMNNLISCSKETHNTIHYLDKPSDPFVERKPGDTQLWARRDDRG